MKSYHRRCRNCGRLIQLRRMPGGQWVAFEGYDQVHDCDAPLTPNASDARSIWRQKGSDSLQGDVEVVDAEPIGEEVSPSKIVRPDLSDASAAQTSQRVVVAPLPMVPISEKRSQRSGLLWWVLSLAVLMLILVFHRTPPPSSQSTSSSPPTAEISQSPGAPSPSSAGSSPEPSTTAIPAPLLVTPVPGGQIDNPVAPPQRAPVETTEMATFTIGSTEEDVRTVQGVPSRIDDLVRHTWWYGSSYVRFDSGGKVTAYDNLGGNLHVRVLPRVHSTATYITLGSTQDDVLSVQGTPSRLDDLVRHTWWFGSSFVRFDSEGRVRAYDNLGGTLRVRMLPQTPYVTDYFSIGSTQDEVLSVQGTPTRVDDLFRATWWYGPSFVRFDSLGRVRAYDNLGGNLRVK